MPQAEGSREGRGLELSASSCQQGRQHLWLQWGEGGAPGVGVKGQDDPGGPGLDGQLGVWQVELGREGRKEGKEESSCPLHLHPNLVMCWVADEAKKGPETLKHLLTDKSAWKGQAGL